MSQRPATGMERWQRIARRIRVPLGFLAAALFLVDLGRTAPRPAAIAWSLALVLPGLWLRGWASGCVRKDRELTTAGPYAYTRNPLYLGSILIAAGFCLSVLSWPLAVVLAAGFALVYIPVIASEERFLRAAFPAFDAYSRQVPRLLPRLTSARAAGGHPPAARGSLVTGARNSWFSLDLYRKHREYNAVLGAALLYLSLLFLHPALAAIFHGTR